MNRTRAVAAGLLTIGLLAPSQAFAAPATDTHAASVVKHPSSNHGMKKGHNKARFTLARTGAGVSSGSLSFRVHGGQNKALRGQVITVVITSNTKIRHNQAPVGPHNQIM